MHLLLEYLLGEHVQKCSVSDNFLSFQLPAQFDGPKLFFLINICLVILCLLVVELAFILQIFFIVSPVLAVLQTGLDKLSDSDCEQIQHLKFFRLQHLY